MGRFDAFRWISWVWTHLLNSMLEIHIKCWNLIVWVGTLKFGAPKRKKIIYKSKCFWKQMFNISYTFAIPSKSAHCFVVVVRHAHIRHSKEYSSFFILFHSITFLHINDFPKSTRFAWFRFIMFIFHHNNHNYFDHYLHSRCEISEHLEYSLRLVLTCANVKHSSEIPLGYNTL